MNVQKAITELSENHLFSSDGVNELGSGLPFIFVIQDAYILDCQKQIIRAIRVLARHGLKLVAEEGFEGRVPSAEHFGFIHDLQEKRRVVAHLLLNSGVGAAGFCDALQDPPIELWGVDNIALHLRSVEDYRIAFNASVQVRPRLLLMIRELFGSGI